MCFPHCNFSFYLDCDMHILNALTGLAMRAKELVPVLADLYRIPLKTAVQIDRALAEAGYRAKGVGRSWPEMTREEAIYFMIACAVCDRPTKAAEVIQLWKQCRCKLYIKRIDDRRFMKDAKAYKDGESTVNPFLEFDYLDDVSETFQFLKDMDGTEINFIDYLLLLCRNQVPLSESETLLELEFLPEIIGVNVNLHQFYRDMYQEYFSLPDAEASDSFDPEWSKLISITVPPNWLQAIMTYTEDGEAKL